MTIGLFDVDKTLADSGDLFVNSTIQSQDDPEWRNKLRHVGLLQWVKDRPGMMRKYRIALFVTGRGIHLSELTAAWLQEKFPELADILWHPVYIGFQSPEQYLECKKLAIINLVQSFEDIRDKAECMVFYEDDPKIVSWAVDYFKNVPLFFIIQVVDGIPHNVTSRERVKLSCKDCKNCVANSYEEYRKHFMYMCEMAPKVYRLPTTLLFLSEVQVNHYIHECVGFESK
jgi:hypothetical protein